jgi:hypothetical protein
MPYAGGPAEIAKTTGKRVVREKGVKEIFWKPKAIWDTEYMREAREHAKSNHHRT